MMTIIQGQGSSGEQRKPEVGLKQLRTGWMDDYALWHRTEFKTEPPQVTGEIDDETHEPVFKAVMAYTFNLTPSFRMSRTMATLRKILPGKTDFSIILENERLGEKVVFMSISDPGDSLIATGLLSKGERIKVSVAGEAKPEFREKAAWVAANILSDPSFNEKSADWERKTHKLASLVRE